MKLKNILLLSNLFLFSTGTLASDYKPEVLWNSGRLLSNQTIGSVLTKGKAEAAFLSLNIKKQNINLKGQNLYFNFKVSSIAYLKGLEFRLSETKNAESFYYYSFPLFDDIEFNYIKSDEWVRYGLSSGNFKLKGKAPKKLNYLTVYINDNKHPVAFHFKSIEKKIKTTKGIVSLTFDDGYLDHLQAAKIMHKYKVGGTAYLMPRDIGKKGYLDNKQSLLMQKKMGWDLQFHHETPLIFFSSPTLQTELDYGFKYFKKNQYHTNQGRHLAYPLGKWTPRVKEIIKKNFNTARVAGGGMETIPPADLHLVRTYNVLNTTTLKQLEKVIESAKENRQWLILMFHYLKDSPEGPLDYSPKNFEALIKLLVRKKIDVLTIDQVWKQYLQ